MVPLHAKTCQSQSARKRAFHSRKKNLVFSLTLATNLLFTQKFPLVNHLKCLKVV